MRDRTGLDAEFLWAARTESEGRETDLATHRRFRHDRTLKGGRICFRGDAEHAAAIDKIDRALIMCRMSGPGAREGCQGSREYLCRDFPDR